MDDDQSKMDDDQSKMDDDQSPSSMFHEAPPSAGNDTASVEDDSDNKQADQNSEASIEKKFGFLRFLSGLLILIALVGGALGVLGALEYWNTSYKDDGTGTLIFLSSLGSALLIIGVSRGIKVALAIEENTRGLDIKSDQSD
jgi:hypothetical protein